MQYYPKFFSETGFFLKQLVSNAPYTLNFSPKQVFGLMTLPIVYLTIQYRLFIIFELLRMDLNFCVSIARLHQMGFCDGILISSSQSMHPKP